MPKPRSCNWPARSKPVSSEIEIRPNERILFLEISDIAVIIDFARRAPNGAVVGLGDADGVRGARRAAADLDNVMFVPATPDDIPWRDGFFTLVVETRAAGPD